MWVSIGSDLRIDTRRDLDDVGATHIFVHALNKLPYGRLSSAKVHLFFWCIPCNLPCTTYPVTVYYTHKSPQVHIHKMVHVYRPVGL